MIAWNDYFPLAQAEKRAYVILFIFLIWVLKFLLLDVDAVNIFQYKDAHTRKKLLPLQNQFRGAMQFLKKTVITKHGKQVRLNQLPWYLLLGPSQTGKTSLLANSNANFILQRQFQNQNIHNLEASEICNWWVTRDASIIDVPGKYLFSQDKLPASTSLWRFFLRMIKKQRGKDGVDGIVITLPLPEFMHQQDTKKQQALQRALFQRLHELQKIFPQTLPYYLVITKCDLLPGFAEYFAELGQDEASQAWGVMLPDPENNEPVHELFVQHFNALIKKLNQQLIYHLHQERNPNARPAIKDFPLQVERLKEAASDFIKKLSTTDLNLSLQGVYLQTTAEPETVLLEGDAFSNQRAVQLFKEPTQASRTYFIKQFITHGLGNMRVDNASAIKKQIWKQRTAFAASIGIISLTAFVLGRDFETGVDKAYSIKNNLSEYQLAIQNFHNPDEHLSKTIELLDTLRKSVKHIGFKLDFAHLLSFYTDKSQNKAGAIYQQALQNILLPELKNYFEDYLTIPVNKNSDSVYAVLKSYLMLNEVNHRQADFFVNTLTMILPITTDKTAKEHLINHVLLALQSPQALGLNNVVIQKTREFLTATPSAQLGYIILKNINDNNVLSEIDLGVNNTADPIFVSQHIADQLPNMFTAKTLSPILGREVMLAASEAASGNWVLGNSLAPRGNTELVTALVDQIRTTYINNYVDVWESLLSNIQLSTATDLTQIDAMILRLISNNSPLLQLLQTLHNNTYYQPIITASPKLQSLGMLVDKNGPSDNLLYQIFSGLRQMHQYLQPILTAQNRKQAAFEAISYRMKNNVNPDAITQLRIIAEKSPEPIKSWLNKISNDTWHFLMDDASLYINTAWQDQVMRFYHADIANRYPFTPASNNDIDLQRFTIFFGNPGLIYTFYSTHLQPLVDTSAPEWKWKSADNVKLPFSDDALRQIQQALRINHTFFPNRDNKLYVQFAIEPAKLGKSIKQIQLNINDRQIVDKDNDVHSPHVITWPNNTTKSKMTSVQVTLDTKEVVNRQYPGDWGWFRLVNQSFESMVSHKQTLLNLSVNNVPIKYYLYTEGQVNPFLSLNLQHFNLPEKLC